MRLAAHTIRSILLLALVWVAPSRAADERPLDFTRDVRPILSNACFQCHGPDAGDRQAELRLDRQDDAFADRDGTPAFVVGRPDQSEAIRRIESEDPAEQMPPVDSGKSLTPEQRAILRRWLAEGGPWDEHWAFRAPERPALPEVKNSAWMRNPIDAFILARLEREGLQPSVEADRVTQLRRLSLDLVGLPPAVSEVDEFVLDNTHDAYARQVERLLASPHYGERWGRLWLDAARYADSDGYEKDKARQVYFYRDWVVGALNRDLPYNQFVIEQIAGDLLPGATQDQQVATGFLRNSMTNEEGGVDPEQFRMEAMFDRIDAIGKSVLGLTIQCAQCHSHKFDPISQEDYYRIFAFLNNGHEANVAVYTPAEQQQREEIFAQIRALEEELRQANPDWAERLASWEAEVTPQQEWIVPPLTTSDLPTGGEKYQVLADGSVLAGGYAPTKHRVDVTLRTDVRPIRAIRLELLCDPNLPLGGPGRSIEGTAALTEFEVDAAPADAPDQRQRIKFIRATADVNPAETPLAAYYHDRSDRRRVTGPIEMALDGSDDTAWGIDAGPGRRNQPRQAVFVPESPLDFPAGTILTVMLKQNHGGWNSDDNQNHNLGRFRLSVTSAENAVADPLPAAVREIVSIPRDERTPEQNEALFSCWRSLVSDWSASNEKIEALWKQHPTGSAQLVLLERDKPRMTHRLDRGDFLKPQETISPGVPAFLHALPEGAPETRLTFAQWLVDRRSPTTARAIVNRVWQAYFGVGLVSTSEDLGSQSEAPSHPELLDWLAVEFMDSGWSLKHLHRLIVESATYRQSSHVAPELLAADPYNRLVARGPRLRLEAELVRDVALAASGLLNPALGGPSVCPPAPEFLFEPPASYGPKVWNLSQGEDRYRRALYTFRFRSVPYPALQAFDAPNGDFSCVRRPRSNTPQQALTTLNEPLFVECAQALALTTLREGGATPTDCTAFAFRRCVARTPSQDETNELVALWESQRDRFARGELEAWKFAAADPQYPPELPEGAEPADLAAWTAVARVLLNLDETITKE
ncbi:MAG: PSD1 domain-containing protein [Pirellulales bacterium]|nr:PSD1 domain-containing protein [Pirellulales bacterium]